MRALVRQSLVVVALTSAAAIAGAQQSANATAAAALPIPNVGDMAPDFTVRGATRFGLLRDPVRLADFRGQTVVLWFFVRARTRG